jgi:hypothetical protein
MSFDLYGGTELRQLAGIENEEQLCRKKERKKGIFWM